MPRVVLFLLGWLATWGLLTSDRWKRPLAAVLRTPVWPANELEALLLPWQYGRMPDGRWWTSPLGILNGVLADGGFLLVTHHADGTAEREQTAWPSASTLEPPYLSFRRQNLW